MINMCLIKHCAMKRMGEWWYSSTHSHSQRLVVKFFHAG